MLCVRIKQARCTCFATQMRPKAVWSRRLRNMQVSLCWWSLNCCVQACKQTQRDTQGRKRAKCAHVGDTNDILFTLITFQFCLPRTIAATNKLRKEVEPKLRNNGMPDCMPSSFPASSRKLVRASIKKASVIHTAAEQFPRRRHGGATRLGLNKKSRKRETHLGQDTSALFQLPIQNRHLGRTHVLCRTAPRHTATSPLFENDAGHFISVGSRVSACCTAARCNTSTTSSASTMSTREGIPRSHAFAVCAYQAAPPCALGRKSHPPCSEACGLHVGGGILPFPQRSRDHADLRGGTSNALSHDPVSTTIGRPWSREDPVPFPRPAAVDTRNHKSQQRNGDTSVSEFARAHLHATTKNRTNEA